MDQDMLTVQEWSELTEKERNHFQDILKKSFKDDSLPTISDLIDFLDEVDPSFGIFQEVLEGQAPNESPSNKRDLLEVIKSAFREPNCPQCKSKNVQKAASYAPRKFDGAPTQKTAHQVPNTCRDCGHEW